MNSRQWWFILPAVPRKTFLKMEVFSLNLKLFFSLNLVWSLPNKEERKWTSKCPAGEKQPEQRQGEINTHCGKLEIRYKLCITIQCQVTDRSYGIYFACLKCTFKWKMEETKHCISANWLLLRMKNPPLTNSRCPGGNKEVFISDSPVGVICMSQNRSTKSHYANTWFVK